MALLAIERHFENGKSNNFLQSMHFLEKFHAPSEKYILPKKKNQEMEQVVFQNTAACSSQS